MEILKKAAAALAALSVVGSLAAAPVTAAEVAPAYFNAAQPVNADTGSSGNGTVFTRVSSADEITTTESGNAKSKWNSEAYSFSTDSAADNYLDLTQYNKLSITYATPNARCYIKLLVDDAEVSGEIELPKTANSGYATFNTVSGVINDFTYANTGTEHTFKYYIVRYDDDEHTSVSTSWAANVAGITFERSIENPEAQIGTTDYATLKEAIAKVEKNGTIKLLRDCVLDGETKYTKGNGFTLTADAPVKISGASDTYLLGGEASVTIGNNITIENTSSVGAALSVSWKDYSLTIDGATITAASGSAIINNCAYAVTIKGAASINGSVMIPRTDVRASAKVVLTDYTGTNPITLVKNTDSNAAYTVGKDYVDGDAANYTFTDDTYILDADGVLQLKPTSTTVSATQDTAFSAADKDTNADAQVWTVKVTPESAVKSATWTVTGKLNGVDKSGTQTATIPAVTEGDICFGVVLHNIPENVTDLSVSITVE